MSPFTQPLCFDCWVKDRADADGRVPMPTQLRNPEPEQCCKCGRLTIEGIYIGVDPATVPHPRKKPDENPTNQT